MTPSHKSDTRVRVKSPNSHVVHLMRRDYWTLCGREVPATWSLHVAEEVDYHCLVCLAKAQAER
jgi:hypothetical protein